MSELSCIHFLRIKGLIDRQKRDEFERTVQFVCEQLSIECNERSLSVEKLYGDQYYFFMTWSTENALRTFMLSNNYQLVRSAFDALGVLEKIEIGYNAEIKTIHIHQL